LQCATVLSQKTVADRPSEFMSEKVIQLITECTQVKTKEGSSAYMVKTAPFALSKCSIALVIYALH